MIDTLHVHAICQVEERAKQDAIDAKDKEEEQQQQGNNNNNQKATDNHHNHKTAKGVVGQ